MPDRIKSNVCRLNEENVVNPPHIPTITNNRILSGTAYLTPAIVKVPKKPMINEPIILIRTVLVGKCALLFSIILVSA
jgi:hypothetical protein